MPFTFLSHQAPVLPLKLAWPKAFDGTALVVGSALPDLVFVLHGTDWYVDAHTIGPQFWLCAPATVALTWIVKRTVAGTLGPHLPDLGVFHLRDYARLQAWPGAGHRRAWIIVILSALIGSLSHLVLDSFTHGFGWIVHRVEVLQWPVFELPASLTGRTVYTHDLLQVAATVIGAAVTIWCLHDIGRRRRLTRWYPNVDPAHPTTRSRLLLWGCTGAGLIAGAILAGATAQVGGAQDLIIRVADVTLLGLLVGCLGARPAMR